MNKWIKQPVIGLASKIIYAEAGDQVEVIETAPDGLSKVRGSNGEIFHTRESNLTDIKPEIIKDDERILTAKTGIKANRKVGRGKATKSYSKKK